MPTISVLLVGASGAIGKPLLEELQRQKSTFHRLAILAAPNRAAKFDGLDVEVIAKSLIDPTAYEGRWPSHMIEGYHQLTFWLRRFYACN